MGLLDKDEEIIPISARFVVENTKSLKKNIVDKQEYVDLMTSYFRCIHKVFSLSYSNVKLGGNMYFVTKDRLSREQKISLINRIDKKKIQYSISLERMRNAKKEKAVNKNLIN